MIKLLLVVFNVIAVIIGLALLGVGAYSKYEYGQILSLSESKFTSIPALLMILGVLVFILGFLGCFGAFKENRVLLVIYSILLTLVLMGECVAIIISLIYKGKIESSVQDGLDEKIEAYIAFDAGSGGSEDDKDIVDKIQEMLDCCGVHGTDSYLNNTDWKHADQVPASCCKTEGEEKYCTITGNAGVYTDGCLDIITTTLSNNTGLIVGIGFGFVFIQIIGICLGCYLSHRIKREGYKEV